MPLHPEFAAMLQAAAEAGGPALNEQSPQEGRAMYRAMQPPAPEIVVGKVEDRSVEGPGGALDLRIYTPENSTGKDPLVMMFHGGGWVIGDLDTADSQSRDLCALAHCVVVSVDYRLAPEHAYPAAADDCYAATLWAVENAAALGADPDRLAVAGDSAGGNLAAVVSLMARDRKGPKISFQLLAYPVTELSFDTPSYSENADGYLLTREGMKWFWGHYCPGGQGGDEAYASPMKASDLSGLPPALIMTAEFDPLRDEGEAYAEALKAAGNQVECIRYDGLIHGFWAMSRIVPAGRAAFEHSAAALKSALS